MKKVIILAVITLSVLSCTTPTTRRGSLSGAFEAANEPEERDRRVEDGYEVPEYRDEYPDYEPDTNESYTEPLEEPDFTYLGIEMRYSHIYMNDFFKSVGTNISFGSNTDGFATFLKAGFNWYAIEGNNLIFEQFNGGLVGLNAGLEFRKNLTEAENPYYIDLVIDANLEMLPWKYNNEVTSVVIDEYGNTREDKINYDFISSFSLGIGPGISIWNQKSFALFIDPTFGFTLFHTYTGQGFTNDVFDSYLYFKLMFKLFAIKEGK